MTAISLAGVSEPEASVIQPEATKELMLVSPCPVRSVLRCVPFAAAFPALKHNWHIVKVFLYFTFSSTCNY